MLFYLKLHDYELYKQLTEVPGVARGIKKSNIKKILYLKNRFLRRKKFIF